MHRRDAAGGDRPGQAGAPTAAAARRTALPSRGTRDHGDAAVADRPPQCAGDRGAGVLRHRLGDDRAGGYRRHRRRHRGAVRADQDGAAFRDRCGDRHPCRQRPACHGRGGRRRSRRDAEHGRSRQGGARGDAGQARRGQAGGAARGPAGGVAGRRHRSGGARDRQEPHARGGVGAGRKTRQPG